MARRLSTAGPVLTLRRSTRSSRSPRTDRSLAGHDDRHLGTRNAALCSTGTRTRHYKPERICPFALGRNARMSRVPVVVVKLMAAKSRYPPMGITFFTGQTRENRPLLSFSGSGDPASAFRRGKSTSRC